MYFPLFVGVLCLSLICYALLYVHSSFAFILKTKRKLVALLLLSYRCLVTVNVMWLFLTLPWVGLQYVIVVFPDHTHLLLFRPSVSLNLLNLLQKSNKILCKPHILSLFLNFSNKLNNTWTFKYDLFLMGEITVIQLVMRIIGIILKSAHYLVQSYLVISV